MFNRTRLLAIACAAVAAAASTPAHAMDLTSTSEVAITDGTTSAVGACSFLASGPSLDPASTPYHVAGSATIVSTKVVVSTSIRCRLRLANVSGQPQVGNVLAQALPGNNSAVAGDIDVSSFGPFVICTYIDAVFSDTTHLNKAGTEGCRPLTRI